MTERRMMISVKKTFLKRCCNFSNIKRRTKRATTTTTTRLNSEVVTENNEGRQQQCAVQYSRWMERKNALLNETSVVRTDETTKTISLFFFARRRFVVKPVAA